MGAGVASSASEGFETFNGSCLQTLKDRLEVTAAMVPLVLQPRHAPPPDLDKDKKSKKKQGKGEKGIAISCTSASALVALKALTDVLKQIMVVKYHAPEDRPRRLDHRKRALYRKTTRRLPKILTPRSK